MSPSFPAVVPVMPTARIGPEMTQVSVDGVDPRSAAMAGMLTARMVMENTTVNRPSSTTAVTIHA